MTAPAIFTPKTMPRDEAAVSRMRDMARHAGWLAHDMEQPPEISRACAALLKLDDCDLVGLHDGLTVARLDDLNASIGPVLPLLLATYAAGFAVSCQGYNAENPFDYTNRDPDADPDWIANRDQQIARILAAQEPAV